MNLAAPAVIHSEEHHWGVGGRRLMAGLAPGRRQGQLPGSHVLDLADLKKALMLCNSCLPKFNSASYGYVSKSNIPFVKGRCDGCSKMFNRMRLLVHNTMACTL